MNWTAVLAVFVGGGLGSLLRFLISWYLPYQDGFPWATFWANMLSCLIIGALLAVMPLLGDSQRLLLITGFCGGLSTFSAFSRETLQLLQRGDWWIAGAYVLLSLLAGLGLVFLAYRWLQR
jgi:fluoride exporter